MTVREAETVSTSAHYGHGIVFCEGKNNPKKCCHKDGVTLFRVNNGYDQQRLTDSEISKLYAQAFLHDKEFPQHDIRIIIFEGK